MKHKELIKRRNSVPRFNGNENVPLMVNCQTTEDGIVVNKLSIDNEPFTKEDPLKVRDFALANIIAIGADKQLKMMHASRTFIDEENNIVEFVNKMDNEVKEVLKPANN